MRVACIIVTRNRMSVLQETLQAVGRQDRAPDQIYVVDNASDDGTRQFLERNTDVVLVALEDNGGYAAGLAAGIAAAWDSGYDFFWLMDDDSSPHPEALSRLSSVASTAPSAGIVGLRGGLFRYGIISHVAGPQALASLPSPAPGVRQVGFVLVDGALLRRSAVEAAGPPRSDFFMMLEDIELSWRISRAGLKVLVLEDELIDRGHLGVGDRSGGGPQWRRYYQSRNHVRWAIESRSLGLLLGCLTRQARFIVVCLMSPRRRWRRLTAHLRGIRDGVLGRMGRTVDPGSM